MSLYIVVFIIKSDAKNTAQFIDTPYTIINLTMHDFF